MFDFKYFYLTEKNTFKKYVEFYQQEFKSFGETEIIQTYEQLQYYIGKKYLSKKEDKVFMLNKEIELKSKIELMKNSNDGNFITIATTFFNGLITVVIALLSIFIKEMLIKNPRLVNFSFIYVLVICSIQLGFMIEATYKANKKSTILGYKLICLELLLNVKNNIIDNNFIKE